MHATRYENTTAKALASDSVKIPFPVGTSAPLQSPFHTLEPPSINNRSPACNWHLVSQPPT